MRASICYLFGLLVCGVCSAQEKPRFLKPTRKDKALVAGFLNDFSTNRAKFDSFATFIKSDISTNSFRPEIRDSVLERNYLYVRSDQKELKRFDDQTISISASSEVSSSGPWRSIVQEKLVRKQYLADRLYATLDDLGEEATDPPEVFDPWTASIANPVEFGNGKADDKYELTAFPMKRFEYFATVGNIKIARFRARIVGCDIAFDSKVANLPVKCTWLWNIGTTTKPELVKVCSIETEWKRCTKNVNGWLPARVNRWHIVGHPHSPNVQMERILRFNWYVGSDFPAGIFDPLKLPADRVRDVLLPETRF